MWGQVQILLTFADVKYVWSQTINGQIEGLRAERDEREAAVRAEHGRLTERTAAEAKEQLVMVQGRYSIHMTLS